MVRFALFCMLVLAGFRIVNAYPFESDIPSASKPWLHIGISSAITWGTCELMELPEDKSWSVSRRCAVNSAVAFGVSTGLSFCKEWFDVSTGYDFSWDDIGWGIAGFMAGASIYCTKEILVSRRKMRTLTVAIYPERNGISILISF